MITTRTITREVARHYHVTPERIMSRDRSRIYFLPRRMTWGLARELTPLSVTEIGRRTGGFDHSSVLHGLRQFDEQVSSNPAIAEAKAKLREVLTHRDSEETKVGSSDPRSALDIAKVFLAGSIATTEPTVRELRMLCEEVVRSAARIAQLASADVLEAIEMSEAANAKFEEVTASVRMLDAAEEVARSADALAIDKHTPRERGSLKRHEAALMTLRTLFGRI